MLINKSFDFFVFILEKILIIKPTQLALSVIAALTVFSGIPSVANAAVDDYGVYGTETALELARNYAGRYTGSEQEINAANYMQERMTISGDNLVEMREFTFTPKSGIFRGQPLISNNVVVTQKGTSDKTIYIGAHYDSAVAYANYDKLEALDDNASGAGVLTELVRNLDGIQVENSVEFIAFGAEEGGLNGSKSFVSNMTDEQIANALGMVNLDSLITGDKMYANAGRNAYDADGNPVPSNTSLRDNAHTIAKELGIDLQMNLGLIPEGETEPYRPEGVGCCSDQDSFDGIVQVVGFEATDWSAGDELDGYTQTSNPAIPDGNTWHNPELDNEETLVAAFGQERIDQRMSDYSKIITRLIVEQTNADILQSNKSAIALQNTMNNQLSSGATASHAAVLERVNGLGLNAVNQPDAFNETSKSSVWVDASQSYIDSENGDNGLSANVGIYGEYVLQPKVRLGLGVTGSVLNNSNVDNGIDKDKSYGVQAYSMIGGDSSPWWNTTSLSYSKHDIDANRTVNLTGSNGINIIDNSERGSTDADVFSAYNELGYNFLVTGNVAHGAFAALDYNNVEIDGYTSGNDQSRTALEVDSTSADSFDGELGYQMQYGFNVKELPVKLQTKLSYVHAFKDGQTDSLSTVSLADGQQRLVTVGGADQEEDYGRFGLSLSTNVNTKVHAYLSGDTTFARDNNESAMQVGLQYQF